MIPSHGNGPYAIKITLGWYVIGAVDMKDGKKCSCYLIAVTESSSGGTVRHHFAIEDKCQKVRIHEMLIKLCKQDFLEAKTAKDEISYEDKKFIKTMNEESVKIGRNCQTILPFRSKEVHFLNNRRLTESSHPMMVRFCIFLIMAYTTQVNLTR